MALTDNLIAYWKLDETSGNRADSVGSSTLTDNNTVTYSTGKIGNAGSFAVANSEYLSAADSAALSTTSSFTISAWVYLASKSVNRTIVAKYDSGSTDREYMLHYLQSSDVFEFVVSSDGSSGNSTKITASSAGSPAINTWYHVVAWFDDTGNQIGISVNGTSNTTSHTGSINDGSSTFAIGAIVSSGSPVETMDGRIDEVGLWKVALSSAERTQLYNSGNGLTYPFATARSWGAIIG